MKHLVHERGIDLFDSEGQAYDRAFVWAEPQPGGTWAAWIEFVSSEGRAVLQTDRETSQSNLESVAYWATGLEPLYFEGAFRRAMKRQVPDEPVSEEASMDRDSPLAGGGVVRLRLETLDPEVPLRLMATRTLVPGLRRLVHGGGVLIYEGMSEDEDDTPAYELFAQFGSDNASAVLANTIWNALHDSAARLSVDGIPVPIDHVAIKHLMLGALVP
jgi:hypothetical protein